MIKSLLPVLFILTLLYSAESELVVAVIGSNDIHGKAFPTMLARQDTGQKYQYGGLIYMATLIDIIKQENQGNTIFLDAGDQFQGGIQSSKLISSGQIMNDFYDVLDVKANSIGNHQFDFGPQFLMPYLSNKQTSSNLAANLRSQKGQINFLPKQKSSGIFEMANGIKIGVVGLSTLQTPSTTSGFSGKKFPMYRFLEYRKIIIDESTKLKRAGANAVLILSHIGDACPIDLQYANRTKKTIQQQCPEDQLSKLIESLPQGTVDGVVQGHRHRTAHHYKNDIPYMGTINGGYYINVMYLIFDDDKTLTDSLIEGPIPVCQRIFQNLGRCNYLNKDQISNAGPLVHWKFHNRDVVAHSKLSSIFNERWLPKMQPYLQQLVNNEVQLFKVETQQSQLANLFTNLIHQAVPQADFVLINPGAFRTEWVPGVIQYQHFYNMLPFENYIYTFDITGAQLLQVLRISQSGEKGFYQCWNLQMEVTYQNMQKGFISAKFIDGSQIDPIRTYKGATLDFLLDGGDDFKDIINIIYTPRGLENKGDFKALVKPFLVDMKIIENGTLIDPEKPRLIVH